MNPHRFCLIYSFRLYLLMCAALLPLLLHASPLTVPPDGPVLTCTIFNDGIIKVKLDFLINSTSSFDLWQRYQEGKVQATEIHRYAIREYYLQDETGNFREVSRSEWRDQIPRHPNYDVLVEIFALPLDFIGDGVCTVYYTAKGDYESAAYSAIAMIIPFANGSMIRGGKYLVRLGAKVQALTPPQIWKLRPWDRGNLIEQATVLTRYAPAGFSHMAEASRWWPIFDVVKGNLAVSIKSTNALKGFGSLYDNIRELNWLISSGAKNGETLITRARLDLYVPEGFDFSVLDEVQEFASLQSISVNIRIF